MAKTPTPVKTPEQPKAEATKPVDQTPPTAEPKTDTEGGGEEQAEETRGTIPARILVDQGRHKCNTLALLTESEAANCNGWADLSPEAVEYAASQTDPEELEKLEAAHRAAD